MTATTPTSTPAPAVPSKWRTAPDLLTSGCLADHGLGNVAGYVVTLTIGPDGKIIRDRLGHIGIDHSFHGARRYLDALHERNLLRSTLGNRSWATIQTCYECGCRAR